MSCLEARAGAMRRPAAGIASEGQAPRRKGAAAVIMLVLAGAGGFTDAVTA